MRCLTRAKSSFSMSLIHNVTSVLLIFWVMVLNPNDLLQLITAPLYLISLATFATSILSAKIPVLHFVRGGKRYDVVVIRGSDINGHFCCFNGYWSNTEITALHRSQSMWLTSCRKVWILLLDGVMWTFYTAFLLQLAGIISNNQLLQKWWL